MAGKKRLLIVEDEPIIGLSIRKRMLRDGYEVIGLEYTGERAIEMTNSELPDLIIMDIRLMGELDGIETARLINLNHEIPIIFITGLPEEDIRNRLHGITYETIVNKPIQFEELLKISNLAVV